MAILNEESLKMIKYKNNPDVSTPKAVSHITGSPKEKAET